jgi:hypothetical protein
MRHFRIYSEIKSEMSYWGTRDIKWKCLKITCHCDNVPIQWFCNHFWEQFICNSTTMLHTISCAKRMHNIQNVWDVHVTMHHDKFLIIKPTRRTDFSNLFLEWNSTCFGQFPFPSSGVFRCTHSNGICHTGLLASCQQTYMTYTIAVFTVKSSWWWTGELSKACRASFQE